MSDPPAPALHPDQLLRLSIQLGAPKKLQVLLSCLQHLDANGEFQLPVTQTARELECSREHVSRVLSELVSQGVLEDLSPQTPPGRRGRRFRLLSLLAPASHRPS